MSSFTKPFFLFLLVVLLFSSPAKAQVEIDGPYDLSAGLPADQVYSIAQTPDQFLWIGTEQGLGYFFDHQVRTDSIPEDLLQTEIFTLISDTGGMLWVGTGSGLFTRTAEGNWEKREGFSDQSIIAILETSSGQIWVGGHHGLGYFDDDTYNAVKPGPKGALYKALTEGNDGRVWAAAETASGTRVFILEKGQLVKTLGPSEGLTPGLDARFLARDPGGRIWFGTDAGLFIFKDATLVVQYTADSGLPTNSIQAISFEKSGIAWIGTSLGLARVDAEGAISLMEELEGVGNPGVSAIYDDSEGNTWLGTGQGLYTFNRNRWRFESSPLVLNEKIIALSESSNGDVLMLTPTRLLQHSQHEWGILLEAGPGVELISIIVDQQGDRYIGTNQGLLRSASSTQQERFLVGHIVTSLLQTEDDAIWAGTTAGLYRMPDASSAFELALEDYPITTLWNSRDGTIWAGTVNRGIFRLRPGEKEWNQLTRINTNSGLPGNIITAGVEDSNEKIWVGTDQGLTWTTTDARPEEKVSWQEFESDDILGGTVTSFAADERSGLTWIGGNNGLMLSDGRKPFIFQGAAGTGLTRITSLMMDQQGVLWIGTERGLVYHEDKQVPPLVAVDELRIQNEPCPLECRELPLPYTVETASIRMSASDLGDADQLRFIVNIQEIIGDEQHTLADQVTEDAIYPFALQAGAHYEISILAIDRHFNTSTEAEKMQFSVAAPTFFQRFLDLTVWSIDVAVARIVGLAGLVGFAIITRHRLINREPKDYTDLLIGVETGSQEGEYDFLYTVDSKRKILKEKIQLNLEWLQASQKRLAQDAVSGAGMQDIGTVLFNTLFPDNLLESLTGKTRFRRIKPVRIRLAFLNQPEISTLPWELTYSPALGFLGLQVDTTVVRSFSAIETVPRKPITGKIRILVVMAMPRLDLFETIDLKAEMQLFQRLQSQHQQAEIAYLVGPEAATITGIDAPAESLFIELGNRLEEGEAWDVIHFACHAGPEIMPTGGFGDVALAFEDARGLYYPVGGDPIRGLLGQLKGAGKLPRLVVLNACRTASASNNLSEVFLAGGVGAVVGMQWNIPDQVANVFAIDFYQNLMRHGHVDYAISAGRSQIAQSRGEDRKDWASPLLFMYNEEGALFKRI